MSLQVLAAQAATKRNCSIKDFEEGLEYFNDVCSNIRSTDKERSQAYKRFKDVCQKALFRQSYDYNDALVKSPLNGEYIDPFEKYLIELSRGKGPIQSQVEQLEDGQKTKRVFFQIFKEKKIETDYKDSDFIEHWINHLSFYKKGTEFTNYLRRKGIRIKISTEKQIRTAKRYFEVLPAKRDFEEVSLKQKYANVLDQDGKTALHNVYQLYDEKALMNLAEFVLNIIDEENRSEYASIKDKNGNTFFHYLAIKKGLLGFGEDRLRLIHVLKSIDKNWVNCLSVQNNQGDTVFHMLAKATRKQSDQIGELLKKMPTDDDRMKCIGIKNKDGDTFLHLAAKLPNKENVIQDTFSSLSLLDNQLKCCELKNDTKETILSLATKFNNSNIANIIFGSDFKKLSIITKKDHLDLSLLEQALIIKNDHIVDRIRVSDETRFNDINQAILNENIRDIENVLISIVINDRLNYLFKEDKTGHSAIRLASFKSNQKIIDTIIKNLSSEDAKKFKSILKEKQNQILESKKLLLKEKPITDISFEISQMPEAIGIVFVYMSLKFLLEGAVNSIEQFFRATPIQPFVSIEDLIFGKIFGMYLYCLYISLIIKNPPTINDNGVPTKFYKSTMLLSMLFFHFIYVSVMPSYYFQLWPLI